MSDGLVKGRKVMNVQYKINEASSRRMKNKDQI